MAGLPNDDGDNRQPTVAGCVLMVLCTAVIFGLAIPLVRWRDPESGRPLPRMVAISVPFLAGAACYGVGAGLLRIFGLRVLAKPKKGPPDRPPDSDGP